MPFLWIIRGEDHCLPRTDQLLRFCRVSVFGVVCDLVFFEMWTFQPGAFQPWTVRPLLRRSPAECDCSDTPECSSEDYAALQHTVARRRARAKECYCATRRQY